jgi:hypothetical protein
LLFGFEAGLAIVVVPLRIGVHHVGALFLPLIKASELVAVVDGCAILAAKKRAIGAVGEIFRSEWIGIV